MDLARPNTTSVAARVILRTGDWGSENAFIAEDLARLAGGAGQLWIACSNLTAVKILRRFAYFEEVHSQAEQRAEQSLFSPNAAEASREVIWNRSQLVQYTGLF